MLVSMSGMIMLHTSQEKKDCAAKEAEIEH